MRSMKAKAFLTAEWRHLAMINYEIEPAILQPYVPCGTELDQWQGRTFVSMVGFLFLRTKVLGLSLPFHRNFEEINLRFYVRRRGPEGWRRGVVFIREIVPRLAIATVARVVYNEQYSAQCMWHRVELNEASGVVEYGWRTGMQRHFLRLHTKGPAAPISDGSEEEFITEHYWGYAAQRDGGCVEYQVEHPRWQVWQVSQAEFTCDIARVYGKPFSAALQARPSSAFVADDSPVIVRRGVRI
jgi:uncharacterized protein